MVTELLKFADELVALGHATAVEPFTIPGDADHWIGLGPHIMSLEVPRRSTFVPKVNFDEVRDNLGERVANGNVLEGDLSFLRSARYTFPARLWEPLAMRIEQRLQVGQRCTADEVDLLLHALALIREDGCSEADDVIGRLANAGQLLHWLQLAESRDHVGCKTWCIVVFLSKRPRRLADESRRQFGGWTSGFLSLLASDDAQLARQVVEDLSNVQYRCHLLFHREYGNR